MQNLVKVFLEACFRHEIKKEKVIASLYLTIFLLQSIVSCELLNQNCETKSNNFNPWWKQASIMISPSAKLYICYIVEEYNQKRHEMSNK